MAQIMRLLKNALLGLAIAIGLSIAASHTTSYAFDVCGCVSCCGMNLCCSTSHCPAGPSTCDMDRDGCGYYCGANGDGDYFPCSDYCELQ